jgi:isoleucyl-tRNA synthetase
MSVARQVVNLGRAARNAAQIKTRQPIEVAIVASGEKEQAAVESLAAVVAEELNVKEIDYTRSAGELVNYVVKPNYRTLGPKFGKNMPAVAAAVAAMPADQTGERISSGRSVMVKVDGHEYEFQPEDFVVEAHEREGFRVEREGGIAVAILTRLSPPLLQEGLARELVHHIQNTRKAADFQIDDRIELQISGPTEIGEMLQVHSDWVQKETLAVSLTFLAERAGAGQQETGQHQPGGPVEPGGGFRESLKVNGLPVTIEMKQV